MAPYFVFVGILLLAPAYALGGDSDLATKNVEPLVVHFAVLRSQTELECRLDPSRKNLRTLWTKDSAITAIPESNRLIVRKRQDGDSAAVTSLNITNVTFADAGKYKCEMVYETGFNDVRQFQINVQDKPLLTTYQRSSIEGENITVNCCVEVSSTLKGLQILWTIAENNVIRSADGDDYTGNTTIYCDQFLFLSHRRYHRKVIRCQVLNHPELTDDVTLEIMYPASVEVYFADSQHLRLTAFEEFSEVSLVCSAEGNPKPNLTLTNYDSGMKLNDSTTGYVESDLSIIAEHKLINITRVMAGEYSCEANNQIGDERSTSFLNITFPVAIEILTSSPLHVLSNGIFEIRCKTTSNPRPGVNLQKKVNDEWETLSTESSLVSQSDHQYIWIFNYTDTHRDYQGLYRCYAFNGVGVPVSSVPIEVAVLAEDGNNFPVYAVCGGAVVLIILLVIIVTVLCYKGNSQSFEIRRDTRGGQSSRHYANDSYPDVVSSGLDRPGASNDVITCLPTTTDENADTWVKGSFSSSFSSINGDPVYAQCSNVNSVLSGSMISARSSEYQPMPGGVDFDSAGYALLNDDDMSRDAGDLVQTEEVCGVSWQTGTGLMSLNQKKSNLYTGDTD